MTRGRRDERPSNSHFQFFRHSHGRPETMASFAALGAAQEQRYVREQAASFLKARLEQMVEAGTVSRAVLAGSPAASAVAGVPTTHTTRRTEWVYKHVKSAVPGECVCV